MKLEELFREHHLSLFRFLSRMTGDPEFAKDMVQETFISIASKPIPPGVSARAWLFQVGQNLARSDLRKTGRRRALLDGRAHSVPRASPSPSPDVDAERAEVRTMVHAALDRLDEKERTILLMREEGFRHREIAAVVGTTTKSVGTMYARALSKLADRLDEIRGEGS